MSNELDFSIRDAYKACEKYIRNNSSEFTTEQSEIARQVKHLLLRLENDYNYLIKINSSLCQHLLPVSNYDENTGLLTFSFQGKTITIPIIPKDPNVPPKLDASSGTASYLPGQSTPIDSDEVLKLKTDFESKLESYYYSAFKVIGLTKVLTSDKNLKCLEITLVRNKLIEHPEKGSRYSFGCTTHYGPVMRPIKNTNLNEYRDKGLIPNNQAFIKTLLKAFN